MFARFVAKLFAVTTPIRNARNARRTRLNAEALETFRRLRQPLLVIHGSVANRRMESYTRLPELEGRPNVSVASLPTGAMPHWERAREVVQRIRDFHDALDGARRAAE